VATPESASSQTPSTRTMLLAAAGIAVVAAVVTGLIVHFASDDSSDTSAITAAAAQTRCPAVTIADNVLPSVVTLSVQGASGAGSGSGETIRDDGYILTNDHVISVGATGGKITVLFSSGATEDATLVGRSIGLDLAVVKVKAADKLPTITFGASESLKVGQPVVALGAPLGLDGSVTSGIVSALGRDVSVPADNGQTARLLGAVQTDASINPGNSGGALVDCKGKLVGVNTAIATVPNGSGGASSGSVGIGFAIPSDLAKIVADQLIAHGEFTPPSIGASTIPIPEAVANRFDVSDGLFIQSVTAGGPAEKAGLAAGDVIVRVDGRAATTPDSLLLATVTKKAGDTVTVDYLRDGKSATAKVTLVGPP
jgi:putative serine protease PepD